MTRILILVAALFLALPVSAQERHALVVGIDRYDHVDPLQKAVNDASAMAEALEGAGFRVDLHLDTDETTLLTAISALAGRAGPGDEVVVFFAGHGIEIDGRNYLLPADVPALRPGQELIMRRRSVPLSDITDALTARQVRVSLLILDACRNNPFPREGTRSLGATRGLARVDPPRGSFVIFSAGAGQEALDRLGDDDPNPNSVFTRALLPRLSRPGLDLRLMIQEVRSEVLRVAESVGHTQFPAVYDQLDGSFMFHPGAAVPEDSNALDTSGMTPAQMNSRGADYLLGNDLAQDDAEAARWFRAAAEAGATQGMINLGVMYKTGRGVAQSDAAAVRWWQAAAAAGDGDGMVLVGDAHDQGAGVPRDPETAAELMLAGIRAGSRMGIAALAETGQTLTPETIRALHRLLQEAGHYRGALAAPWGAASVTALEAFAAEP